MNKTQIKMRQLALMITYLSKYQLNTYSNIVRVFFSSLISASMKIMWFLVFIPSLLNPYYETLPCLSSQKKKKSPSCDSGRVIAISANSSDLF